jgi:hypothetical protein
VPSAYLKRRLEGEPGAATLVLAADDGVVPFTSLVAHPVVAAATEIARIVVARSVLRRAVMGFLVIVAIGQPP